MLIKGRTQFRIINTFIPYLGNKSGTFFIAALGGVDKVACSIENIQSVTHLVWLTGGSLVLEEEWKKGVGKYHK